MILLRVAFLTLLGCICAAAVAMAALVVFRPKPMFDRANPDYAAFASQLAQAQRAFADGEGWAVIDLSPLNGGAWRTACLFGGYTRPVQRLEELGAVVSEADRQRLAKPLGWRLSPVEEFEMLIAFADDNGRAHFIHFDQGVGAEGQHYETCVTKPKTKVAIATWRTGSPSIDLPTLD